MSQFSIRPKNETILTTHPIIINKKATYFIPLENIANAKHTSNRISILGFEDRQIIGLKDKRKTQPKPVISRVITPQCENSITDCNAITIDEMRSDAINSLQGISVAAPFMPIDLSIDTISYFKSSSLSNSKHKLRETGKIEDTKFPSLTETPIRRKSLVHSRPTNSRFMHSPLEVRKSLTIGNSDHLFTQQLTDTFDRRERYLASLFLRNARLIIKTLNASLRLVYHTYFCNKDHNQALKRDLCL